MTSVQNSNPEEEILLAPLTATELQEYRKIGELELAFEKECYDRGDHYQGANVHGEALLIRPRVHHEVGNAEIDFRMRAGRLVRMLIVKHASKLGRYPQKVWEASVHAGWFVVFRRNAIVKEF